MSAWGEVRGRVNCMVVDSSALPEQVVDAAIQSAFKSAGQRCSALRVLCVHEGLYERVLHMLQGAAAELRTGPGAAFDTDVGPLIDTEAHHGVSAYVEGLKTRNLVTNSPDVIVFIQSSATQTVANMQTPCIVEVPNLQAVAQEIFGPVLHLLRWRDGAGDANCTGGGLAELAKQINAVGYGLTLGIHTRIDSRAQIFAAAVHVGNVYVNRNIIGAVVGSQPFGGEGLSGTGPKAGGPNYLLRFCAEQTVTLNTTAAGGNVALLAG